MIAPPVESGPTQAQVLFEAARHRRRRRWATAVIAVAAAIIAGLAALAWAYLIPLAAGPGPAGARAPGAGYLGAAAPAVAWVDSAGQLHVGDPASSAQRVVANIIAAPGVPLAAAGGRVYWVNTGGSFSYVQDLDLATGRIQDLGLGQSVLLSADGSHVFSAEANSLSEVSTTGTRVSAGGGQSLAPPAGWYLPPGDTAADQPVAVADGFLVLSGAGQQLGDWNTQTGRVAVIGTVSTTESGVTGVISAYTPPGAGYSLVAWKPARCQGQCPIMITNTGTGTSVSVRSPLRYGFALGGAFAPDGRQLAVFVSRSPDTGGNTVQVALASTSTGAVRLVPGARLVVGDPVAWARWLPGSRQLMAGGVDRSYLIGAAARSAAPLRLGRSGGGPNYSAAIVTPARVPAG